MDAIREITDHQCPDCDNVRVLVLDGPGPGGAAHEYAISVFDEQGEGYGYRRACTIEFQRGPVAENGVNGITNEALLAVVIDRLRGFQRGPFACRENAVALTHVETALL